MQLSCIPTNTRTYLSMWVMYVLRGFKMGRAESEISGTRQGSGTLNRNQKLCVKLLLPAQVRSCQFSF